MHCSVSALHLAARRALWTTATELGAMFELDCDMLCEVGLVGSGVVEPWCFSIVAGLLPFRKVSGCMAPQGLL